jgi:hypothetical protein
MKTALEEILEYIEINKHSFVNDFELTKMRKYVQQQVLELRNQSQQIVKAISVEDWKNAFETYEKNKTKL